jgi:Protein ChrB, N-terminal
VVVQPRSHNSEWVLLAYRLPRQPSTPRSAVWRKLRRLGAAQLLDGLVALPLDRRNRESFEWIADEIVDAGGEATIWIGAPASAAQERELVMRVSEAAAAEYRLVIDEANRLLAASTPPRRALWRLRRELRRIRTRDYFPVAERELAHQAVEALAIGVEAAPR